ncbi:MAG: putative amidohydrolase, partial [Phenylobacterium sp.]|nr:putative amidohydrolase [Phenylobacterium sp.]
MRARPIRRLLALSALALTAAFAAEARAEVTVLRDFTLIDGTGRPAAPHSAMVIDNGRITWVGPAGKL